MASLISGEATQHWAGKARPRSNGKWPKRALGTAHIRDRSILRQAARLGYRLHIDGALVIVYSEMDFINPTLLFYWFLEKLSEKGIRTIEVSHEEEGWVINSPAVRPGRVLMFPGLLESACEKFGKAGISAPCDKMSLGGGAALFDRAE